MTVEPLTRRSPLAGYADRFAAAPVDVAEEPFHPQWSVRVDPDGAAAATLEAALGLALPDAGRFSGDADRALVWLGPDEWLLTGAVAPEGSGAVVVDVSDQRTTIRLRGTHVREILAKGCALDLHPRTGPTGLAAPTLLAHVPVVLVVLDAGPVDGGADAPVDVRVLVRSTFARHLAEWLLDAVLEYGAS